VYMGLYLGSYCGPYMSLCVGLYGGPRGTQTALGPYCISIPSREGASQGRCVSSNSSNPCSALRPQSATLALPRYFGELSLFRKQLPGTITSFARTTPPKLFARSLSYGLGLLLAPWSTDGCGRGRTRLACCGSPNLLSLAFGTTRVRPDC